MRNRNNHDVPAVPDPKNEHLGKTGDSGVSISADDNRESLGIRRYLLDAFGNFSSKTGCSRRRSRRVPRPCLTELNCRQAMKNGVAARH